jgi:putative resolvase
MNGTRERARRLLAGPAASLVVLDDREVTGGLVRDMIGVLAWLCAHRCGRGPARDRALKAVGCAQRDMDLQAVVKAGGAACEGAG